MKKLTATILPSLAKSISGAPSSVMATKALLLAVGFISLTTTNVIALAAEVHEAHIHGAANLTLAFENGALEVQFESPAMSLLGFEHNPKTKQQIETIEKTKTILSSPEKIITIEGASCTANKVNVEIHGPAGQALQSPEKHDDHDASHSEFFATYQFDCVEGEKIGFNFVALFETFPKLESINANWVTETQQGQRTLSLIAPTIEFR